MVKYIMTWLTTKDFAETATGLSDDQLGQQLVDCDMLLRLLMQDDKRKVDKQPFGQVWAGDGLWLAAYCMTMANEHARRYDGDQWWVKRYTEVLAPRLGMSEEAFANTAIQSVLLAMELQLPAWMDDDRVLRSHRAVLSTGDESLLVWPDGIFWSAVTNNSASSSHGDEDGESTEGTQDVGTRTEVIDQLRAKKYEGPVSYSKTKLLEILEVVESGGSPDLPKRGRRPKGGDESSTGGEPGSEGDLPR